MTKLHAQTKHRRRKFIPVEEAFAEWEQSSSFRKAYAELDDEFALVTAIIEARVRSGLTQEQLAERMGSKQSLVARLERGGTSPSTRTLRRFATATGNRLKITFEPVARKR
ncbi:MAG: helix-turn-helix domain-containing protein [Hyphomicrobium sp.]